METRRSLPLIHLIRHGETEWSLSGRHTGVSDIPLTTQGEEQARRLAARLRGLTFSHVISSPRTRAQRTCELAGFAASMEVDPELREWDYGDFEGRTRAEIHRERPDWNLFIDVAPGGESPGQVLARATRVVQRLHDLEGAVLIFSHGHFLRVLAAAWTGIPVVHAQRLALSTASHGILGFEHERADSPSISLWNEADATLSP